MMKSNRRARVADAKAKRQKITIIAGAGVLALVLAIQVPKMMSLLSPGGEQASAASAPETSTTTASQTQTAAPASTGAPAPVATSAPAATAATAAVTVPAGNPTTRTPTFDAFASKDPFSPQMTTTESAAASDSSGSSNGATNTPAPTGGLAPASPSSGSTTSGETQPPAPTAAVISVNGVPSTVAVGAAFPTADPVFKLVKLGSSVAKVAIADGSYTSGAQAVSIALHASLTLLNTATGARYRLQFVSFAP